MYTGPLSFQIRLFHVILILGYQMQSWLPCDRLSPTKDWSEARTRRLISAPG